MGVEGDNDKNNKVKKYNGEIGEVFTDTINT